MYMTLRTGHAAPGHTRALAEQAVVVTQLMNQKLGTDFRVGIQVGGNPDAVAISAGWEDIADYEAARADYMADEEIMEAVAEAEKHIVSAQDELAQVLSRPGERSAYSILNRARMLMTRVTEAIPFGLEVCEFVEDRHGVPLGFATAVTGNRANVAWFNYQDSLSDAMAFMTELESDPDYLDFFKRSADIYVDGSLDQTIWQRISP